MRELRVRLLALVLTALAPGVWVASLTGVETSRRAVAQAQDRASGLANVVALEEARLVDVIRHTLLAVSHSPAVASRDRAACASWLQHLLEEVEHGSDFNLAVADAGGNVVCSARGTSHPASIAGDAFFRAALDQRDFAVGSYQVGSALGRPVVDFAYPLVDEQGRVAGVVFAELALQRLHEIEREVVARLPTGTTLTKIDADGLVLARQPDPGRTVGASGFAAPVLQRILAAPSGVFRERDGEGPPSLYAFSSVPSKATGGRIVVVLSQPEAVAFAEIHRARFWGLLAAAFAVVFALGLTWVVSERLIVGPATRVAAAVQRLAGGDFTARTGLRYGGEMGDLARAFDEMAASLERREAERRATEETLRASEERYRSLFESANDIVFTLDPSGRLTSVNRAGEVILGYPREDVLGTDVMQLVAPEHRSLVAQAQQRRREGEDAPMTHEIEMLNRAGGRVPLEVSSRLVVGEGGRPAGVQAIARDVGERRRLQAQLALAQKIEAVGRLAAGIAHDFNNLLGVILGSCELMERDPLPERARRRLGQINDAAVRAASLTRQLLAFSRQQVLEPRVIDLSVVIRDSTKFVERLIGEDITLRTALAEDVGRVRADPRQIEQILLNLAVNARDAMAYGGSLSIETANADLDEAYAAVHPGAVAGRYVLLAVSDTGIGMDAETQARIFDPFFTTKPLGKGTGLGLATVYGVVKQSGGYIWVYSELGRGTTFKVYLPRVDEPAEPLAPRRTATEVPRGSETILLVEDDAPLRELERETLEEGGYTVLEAASAFAALEVARLHSGRIDLVLTDVVLPGMNGRALAEQMARLVPDLKVLYVSGYTDEAIAHHGVLEPGIHFLSKPCTRDQLLRKVREILDAGDR